MDPLNKKELFGDWATLLLPITDQNAIDYKLLEEEIDILIEAGVTGIYSNGTAGEFYNQSEPEFDRIHSILADKCNVARMPFQVGCSHMSPQISLERVVRARHWAPSAIQVILPDWWVPSDQEMLLFLERICIDADPIGIVLYNPPHAKKQLSPDDFQMIDSAGIALLGCKVAGGSAQWYRVMREKMNHLSVFIPGHYMASGLKNGAQGAYSNVSCLNPRVVHQWYESTKTDMQGALELEARICYFIETCIAPYLKKGKYSNQAADKFMATVGGWCAIDGRLRWPYRQIPATDVSRVRQQLHKILPEFASN